MPKNYSIIKGALRIGALGLAICGLTCALLLASGRQPVSETANADPVSTAAPLTTGVPVISADKVHQFTSKSMIAVTPGDVRRLFEKTPTSIVSETQSTPSQQRSHP